VFGGWTSIFNNTPDEIYVGGNKVFYRKSGNLFRRDGSTWVNFGSAGTQVVVDDLGQAYKLASNSVSLLKPGSTTWTALGHPLGFAFKLFAGGNKVYATNNLGDLAIYAGGTAWNWISSPAADFAVDSLGVIYSLASNLSNVKAYRNGSWVQVGGAAAGIVAGNRLYARSSSGDIWELYPDGNWAYVTGGWTAWSAGGNRLVVNRLSSWYDYTHQGTSTIF
jgi:hypothetical protein